ISVLGVNGATDHVIEFTGPVIKSLSMDERMTLCNMAIEAGGTCGICPPDETTVDFLWKFISSDYSSREEALKDYSQWISDDDAVYADTITIDISKLSPVSTFGFKPDQVKKITDFEKTKVDQIYIGSCTNGRIEDLRAAAEVLKGKKLAGSVRGILSPATPQIFKMALKEGLIDIFMDAGFCVTNPTCGACLGMSNGVLPDGEGCASTTNRKFNGRMGKGGKDHLTSPASAAATGINGYITDPRDFLG
ncbi:MAG: 3-isopropylmalate dehydratase, partial [Proteobacteria bacterium]|nr:3-isopropylmalate dehydratase [Pseudomonadota bacterium]